MHLVIVCHRIVSLSLAARKKQIALEIRAGSELLLLPFL